MPRRQALAIDRDAAFVAILRDTLAPYGFEIVDVGDSRQGLLWLKMKPPEILFLAVDLPDREGFTVCNRARRLAQGVPIVLATATLPAGEMAIHEITRAHADAYLDKRELDPQQLIRTLARLIDLGPPVEDVTPSAAGSDAAVSPQDATNGPSRIDDLESEANAILAGLSPSSVPSSPPPPPAIEPVAVSGGAFTDGQDLRAEIAQLRHDLEEAQRLARSSPYAGDTLLLRDALLEKDNEIARFQEAVFARDRKQADTEQRLRELALQAAAGKREEQLLARTVDELKAQLESTETMLALAEDEIKELRAQADEEIKRERDAHRRTREDLEGRIADLQASQQQATVRLAGLDRDRKRLEQGLADLAAARAATVREAEAALSRMREAHSTALSALEHKHQRDLAERESAQAVALESTVTGQLAAAQEAHRVELENQKSGFRVKLQGERDRHERALATMRKIHAEMLVEKEKAIAAAQAGIAALESRLAESERARAGREQALEQACQRIVALEESAATQKRAAGAAGIRIDELAAELSTLRASLAETERALEQERMRAAELERGVGEQQQRVKGAEQALLQEQQEREADGRESQQRLKDAEQAREAERTQHEADLRESQQQLTAAEQAHQATRRQAEAAQASAAEQLERLAREKSEALAAAENARREALEKVGHESHAVLAALQREREEEQLAQREHERQMIEIRTREQRTVLEQANQELDAARAQFQEREETLQRTHEEQMGEVRTAADDALRRLTEERDAARARLAELEEELAAANRAIAERENTIADQRGTISSLQALVGDFSTPESGMPLRPKVDHE